MPETEQNLGRTEGQTFDFDPPTRGIERFSIKDAAIGAASFAIITAAMGESLLLIRNTELMGFPPISHEGSIGAHAMLALLSTMAAFYGWNVIGRDIVN